MKSVFKQPSAWVPIAASLLFFAVMVTIFLVTGVPARQPDEGTGAHLFQIWLVLEVIAIAFFAIKWLPQHPKQALLVLTLQILAVLLVCSPVFLLKL